MTTHQERRTQPRFSLPIGYTPIAIRLPEDKLFTLEGHAYDISRGGVQFELDRPLEPGTRVALKIELPTRVDDGGPERAVFAFANIVWMDDEDEGPVRMAAVFTSFARIGDEERLMNQITDVSNRMAA